MDIYYRKQRWKLYLFLFAAVIGLGSLLYTNRLVKVLALEEKKKKLPPEIYNLLDSKRRLNYGLKPPSSLLILT